MDLRKISDKILVTQTDELVKKEREVLADLLRHLQENERRRLYSSLGYKSLFEYTVQRLGYPEDQAWRRIKAMRLMRDIPEIEEKIENGEITLSHISMAGNFFKQEEVVSRKFTDQEKVQVFESIANKTTREAQRELVKLSSSTEVIFDRIRPIGEETIEIRFPAPLELDEKLRRLKGLLAHSDSEMTLAKLVNKLCELGLDKWDPARQDQKIRAAKRISTTNTDKTSGNNAPSPAAPRVTPRQLAEGISAEKKASANECRRISPQKKREIWVRDRGKCVKCGSTHALQIDHCEPHAHGGKTGDENLRLLCRNCNQRSAVESFGANKIEKFARAQSDLR